MGSSDIPPEQAAQGRRLKEARIRAGHPKGSTAYRALGMVKDTYYQYESGRRSLKNVAKQFADEFGVTADWLLFGRGEPNGGPATVPLVGKVGAGNAAHFYATADPSIDRVPTPRLASPDTRAARIVGPSLGQHMEGWLVFFGAERPHVPPEWHGQLCVVGLVDDRILVKWVRPGSGPGFYHLESTAEATMFDEEVVWSALVTDMRPR